MSAFEIKNEKELVVLHRALFAAKFPGANQDPALIGSPVLANLANRVVQALSESQKQENWEEWRQAEKHEHIIQFVKKQIGTVSSLWETWSEEEKESYISYLLSPLIPGKALMKELLK